MIMIQMRNCTQDTPDLNSMKFSRSECNRVKDYDSNEKLHSRTPDLNSMKLSWSECNRVK